MHFPSITVSSLCCPVSGFQPLWFHFSSSLNCSWAVHDGLFANATLIPSSNMSKLCPGKPGPSGAGLWGLLHCTGWKQGQQDTFPPGDVLTQLTFIYPCFTQSSANFYISKSAMLDSKSPSILISINSICFVYLKKWCCTAAAFEDI